MDADAGVGGMEGREQAGQVDGPGRKHRPERNGSLQQPAQCGEVGADRVRPRDTSRARSNTAVPASVSSTPVLVRRSSANPSSASSCPTARETADCARCSSSAASVKVPALTTWTNARSWRSSIAAS